MILFATLVISSFVASLPLDSSTGPIVVGEPVLVVGREYSKIPAIELVHDLKQKGGNQKKDSQW